MSYQQPFGVKMPADFREMIQHQTAQAQADGRTVQAVTGRIGGWPEDSPEGQVLLREQAARLAADAAALDAR